MSRFIYLALVIILLSACGGQTAPSSTLAQAVQATLTALPTPQARFAEVTRIAEVTRVVEVTRIVERVVTVTPSPKPPTQTPTNQRPIAVGEPVILTESESDGTQRLSVLVLIENPNPDWWMPVSKVSYSVFDAEGKIIGTDDDIITVGPSGKAASLVTGLAIGRETNSRIQVELSPKELRPSTAWPGAKVELVQANMVENKIVGQLKNTGKVKIPQTKVIALVHDASGKVIALDFSFADESNPDQTVPFSVNLFGVKNISTFELFLEPELVSGTF